MGGWMLAIGYILLALVILGLVVYCYSLIRRSQAEQSRWRRIADQKYKEGRAEASQILRSAVDQIADDKNRLEQMTDRELLTESVLALGSLGRRLDRLEDSLGALDRFRENMDAISQQTEEIAQNGALLSRQVTEAQDAAAAFQSAVSGTNEAVYSLSDSTHSLEQVLNDIDRQLGELGGTSEGLGDLQSRLDTVLLRINQTLKVSGDNPAAALAQMDSRMGEIHTQLQNMSEGLNLLAESLERVQGALEAPPPAIE